MNAAASALAPPRWKSRLLVALLVAMNTMPLIVFAVDLPNREFMVRARNAALERANVQRLSDGDRRERGAAFRRQIQPTPGSVAIGFGVELFWIVVIAVVARRWFGLRL